jgi:dihydroorotate dehydrogenase electron transfer subunit
MISSPKESRAKVLHHRKIGFDTFRLRLLCPEIAALAEPGQFILLRVNALWDPFLRRPFSFSRILAPAGGKLPPRDEGGVEILYRIVGRGTSLMTRIQVGQRLEILGPLGNGFRMVEGKERAILVGGGIGVAPLLAWAEKLTGRQPKTKRKNVFSRQSPEVRFLVGARNREGIIGVQEIKKMKVAPSLATEDGSLGIRGPATDLLERELLERGHEGTAIYACGPMAMLARVAQIADQFDLPCQVLMESRMACGLGACLGCAVKVRQREAAVPAGGTKAIAEPEESARPGRVREYEKEAEEGKEVPSIDVGLPFRYARACQEGPVFEAREILWESK